MRLPLLIYRQDVGGRRHQQAYAERGVSNEVSEAPTLTSTLTSYIKSGAAFNLYELSGAIGEVRQAAKSLGLCAGG